MSVVIKFYFTSSMLNMFRTLIRPSSGACDFSIVSPHWLCVLVSMCVGVSVWLGWGGIREAVVLQPAIRIPPQPSHTETPTHIETRTHHQCGDTIEKSQAPDDGRINVRNMLSASACYTDTTPTQPHRNSNTHRNKNTRPMWWYNRKVAGSWWWTY